MEGWSTMVPSSFKCWMSHFFLRFILLIIIVKCLFILAAVSPHILAVFFTAKKKDWKYFSVGIKTGFFYLLDESPSVVRGIFLVRKNLAGSGRCLRSSCATIFSCSLDGDMFMHIEVWGNLFLCPFVSRMHGLDENLKVRNGLDDWHDENARLFMRIQHPRTKF